MSRVENRRPYPRSDFTLDTVRSFRDIARSRSFAATCTCLLNRQDNSVQPLNRTVPLLKRFGKFCRMSIPDVISIEGGGSPRVTRSVCVCVCMHSENPTNAKCVMRFFGISADGSESIIQYKSAYV